MKVGCLVSISAWVVLGDGSVNNTKGSTTCITTLSRADSICNPTAHNFSSL